MRKALNFDLDTKEYEKYTNKKPSSAYYKIKKFLNKNDFEHRQGSGYISKGSISNGEVFALIQNMSENYIWLRKSIKQIDVTNIGKQHSLIDAVNTAPFKKNVADIEL